MELPHSDPRRTLSRRMQDFHPADPATQAAIKGEEYFDVTPGHLLSTALETGYFDTLEDCLSFFGLERQDIKRSEPYTQREVRGIEARIHAEADERLHSDEEVPYEQWAERIIESSTMSEESARLAVEELLADASTMMSDENEAECADDIDGGTQSWGYTDDHLKMQVARLLTLLERDGFAMTVDTAAKSFIDHGFLQMADREEWEARWEVDRLKQKLAIAAYTGQRREVEDGVWDLSPFDEEDWDYEFSDLDEESYTLWASKGCSVVLSAKDLRLFASHYAASSDQYQETDEEPPMIARDKKYQALMQLVRNTPARIREVQDHIAYLSKVPQ